MTLIFEYGDRREKKGRDEGMKEGMKELIENFISSGTTLTEISKKTGKSIEELEEILKD